MSRLEIALLGSPEIRLNGKAVKTERRKAVALLAYLACSGKSHTRDHLAALLWPDYGQESAYAYLRRTVWEVNQILGKGWLAVDRERVALPASSALWSDTAVFETLIHSRASSIASWIEAIDLYRGDFLEGFSVADTASFEAWQTQQAAYFRHEYANALGNLVQALALEKEHDQALLYARRWLALDPLNEIAQRALMRLLAEIGDRSGAIRQYESCALILKTELNITPQPETTQLYETILHGEVRAAPIPRAAPDTNRQPYPAPRLPVLPTPFIGRQAEVEQIKTLLTNSSQRLVTLTGPGGTGKTRLAIQAASDAKEMFPDGVYFAALATVPAADAMLTALAKALDFSFYEKERPRQQLLGYLREKRLLLVLDNFEHLLDAADLVVDILAQAPGVKLLATSRVHLNVQGEQLYRVGGMSAPENGEASAWEDPETQAKPFSAVQLFLERARRVQPGFALTQANLKPVLEICQLVQGMPLGLELAAAWLGLLTPDDIAAEIARSLDILETNQVDVPTRQRSIRAVFESSWKLLNEEEQAALQRLCVFRGSFSREAAQQISGASLRTLLGLADKSWLQQVEGGRFQLHDLLWHYGQERLKTHPDEWQEAHDRHAAYFTRFVAEQNARMQGSQQLEGKKAFEAELNTNIKAAWDWLVAERRWDEVLDPFAIGFLQIGTLGEQMAEMIPWVRDARLVLSADPGTADTVTFAVISTLEIFFEENEWIQEQLPLERMDATWQLVKKHQLAKRMGLWVVILAFLVAYRNLDPAAEAQLEEAVSNLRKENDPWKLAFALFFQAIRGGMYLLDQDKLLEAAQIFKALDSWNEQGMIAELLGRHAIHQKQPLYVILEYYQQAKQFYSQLGDETRALFNFLDLAGLFFRAGLVEHGFDIYRETQPSLERVGNTRMLAATLHWESIHATRYSTFEHALKTRQRSQELYQKDDNPSNFYFGLLETGDIFRIFGNPQQAAEFYTEAYPGLKRLNMTLGLGYCERGHGDLAFQAGQYDEALRRYEQYLEYATRENHPWSKAQARAKRALVLACLEKREQARREIHDLLTEIRGWGEDELLLIALLVEPVCQMQEGKHEQAVELAAFLRSHPVAWNEVKQQAQAFLETAASHLTEDATFAAIQRGEGMTLDAVVNEILSQGDAGS